jgi:flagellar biosynthetic protein FliR
MTDIVALSAVSIEAFLLALLRTGGFLAAAPALNHKAVPIRVRIGLSVVIAFALVPQVAGQMQGAPLHLSGLALIAFREILTGVVIGFGFSLLFTGLQAAGELIGLQVGFALANIYDYATERQVGVLGQLELVLGLLLFFAIDGHHLMLRAFFDSYNVVGIAGLHLNAEGLDLILRLSSVIFIIAIKAAAPVMVAVFLTEIALGILARTVPQMNVFIIGFPLKIGIGLFMMATALPLFAIVFGNLLSRVCAGLDRVLAAMVSA